MQIDRHIALSAGWIAGPAFGLAMMAAPEYLHPSHTSAALLFYGGLSVFFLTLLVVFILSIGTADRTSRMLPLITIAIGLAITGGGIAWYFWPQPQSDAATATEKLWKHSLEE